VQLDPGGWQRREQQRRKDDSSQGVYSKGEGCPGARGGANRERVIFTKQRTLGREGLSLETGVPVPIRKKVV